MRTSFPSTDAIPELEDKALAVTVYGLTRRASVSRLVEALAGVPCYPAVIFKIDRYGRLLGVIDYFTDGRQIYYVQVRHWGKDSGQLPLIGWTRDAGKISRGLAGRARKLLMNYSSGVRKRPMKVYYSRVAHDERSARMVGGAS